MKKLLLIILTIFSVCGCAGLGLATVGAVMYYKSDHHEVASVDIKAPSDNVYRAVIDAVDKNANVAIINKDDSAMLLDLQQNGINGSIKVTALNSEITELTITSGVTAENEISPLMAVMKVCKDLKIECTERK